MSILIKGMKMPNACYECEFYNEVCPFDGVGVWYDPLRERADGCPLLEVPDHGDLIEREYAIASACSGRIRTLPTTEDGEDWIRVEEVRQSLKSVPVVIPAERSEEECEDENWYTELDDPKIAERSEE